MMSADVSVVPRAVRNVTAACRGAEALTTLLVDRWEYRQVAVVRIGNPPMRLAGLALVLADQVSRQRRADDSEVDQEVSVNRHCSSTVMPADGFQLTPGVPEKLPRN
jgi:hypothetical protein